MLTSAQLTGTRPNPVLSAQDMFANPAARSAATTQTTPQTAQRSRVAQVAQAAGVTGGDYKVGPATPSLAVAGLLVVIALMFAIRLIVDGAHEVTKRDKTRFREVDVTLWNCLLIGVMAIPGIVCVKFLTVRFLHPRNPVRLIAQAA